MSDNSLAALLSNQASGNNLIDALAARQFANTGGGAALGNPKLAPPNIAEQAAQKYGFVRQHNPMVIVNPQKDRGYAETWPGDEEGDTSYPRPQGFPMGRVGIEIYRPGEFSADDLAAELLHVDPRANAVRAKLMQSFTPAQVQQMASRSLDYQMTKEPDRQLQNGVDAMLRGRVFGQKTDSNVDLSPQQQALVDGLKSYVVTGK